MSKQMYESAYHNTQVATLQLKEPNNFQMISNASFVVEAYFINKTLIFQNLFRGCHFNIERQRSERRQRPTDTHLCVYESGSLENVFALNLTAAAEG